MKILINLKEFKKKRNLYKNYIYIKIKYVNLKN